MPVAATVVLLVHMITVCIIAFVMMHTKSCGMAIVQAVKNMPAVGIAVLYAVMVKYVLQLQSH